MGAEPGGLGKEEEPRGLTAGSVGREPTPSGPSPGPGPPDDADATDGAAAVDEDDDVSTVVRPSPAPLSSSSSSSSSGRGTMAKGRDCICRSTPPPAHAKMYGITQACVGMCWGPAHMT